LFTLLSVPLSLSIKEAIITMDITDLPRGGAQRGLTFGPFKEKRLEAILDSIFKGIQKLNDSDNKQLMLILFKYNRAL
jgi:hypothetical protein